MQPHTSIRGDDVEAQGSRGKSIDKRHTRKQALREDTRLHCIRTTNTGIYTINKIFGTTETHSRLRQLAKRNGVALGVGGKVDILEESGTDQPFALCAYRPCRDRRDAVSLGIVVIHG